jgi:hypothetical protein
LFKGPITKRVNEYADYSNYLHETSYCENGERFRDEAKCMPEPINENPEIYAIRSSGFVTLSIFSIIAGAVAAPFLYPVVMAAAATVPVIGVTAWATGMALTAATGIAGAAAVGGVATGAVSFINGIVQTAKTVSGISVDVLPRDKPIKKENLRSNRIEVGNYL